MNKPTKNELIYLFLILIILVGMVLQTKAFKADIESYQKAYNSCIEEVNRFNGYSDIYGRYYNITQNISYNSINVTNQLTSK